MYEIICIQLFVDDRSLNEWYFLVKSNNGKVIMESKRYFSKNSKQSCIAMAKKIQRDLKCSKLTVRGQ